MTPKQKSELSKHTKNVHAEFVKEMDARKEAKLLSIKQKQKRAGVNFNARNKWLAEALQNAGKRPELFEKAHTLDFVRTKKDADALRKISKKQTEYYLKSRRKKYLKALDLGKISSTRKPDQTDTICIWQGQSVPQVNQTISADGTVVQRVVPTAQPLSAGNSKVVFDINSAIPQAGLRINHIETISTHTFTANINHHGMFRVTSYLEPIGDYTMVCGGDCFSPGNANFYIAARSFITLLAANGQVFNIETNDLEPVFVADLSATCDSDAHSDSFNFSSQTYQLVNNTSFPCDTGDVIVIDVQFDVVMWTEGLSVLDVDMASGGRGLNVPLVVVEVFH